MIMIIKAILVFSATGRFLNREGPRENLQYYQKSKANSKVNTKSNIIIILKMLFMQLFTCGL